MKLIDLINVSIPVQTIKVFFRKHAIPVYSVMTALEFYHKADEDYDTESKNLQSMFVVVERCECWNVVYDKNTKVMYAVSDGAENRGTFTELVDKNGQPRLWEGK